jgi:NADH-quinone oxidoreductase subunit J
MGRVTFVVVALALVASALTVVVHRNPVKSAMALVATLFLLAVMFVFLEAHMIAALQVIVYAGAIMVLFLFVIMLLNLTEEEAERSRRGRGVFRIVAWVAGGVLAGELTALFMRVPFESASTPPAGYGGPEAVARSLFTDSLLPFELTSILLLIAIVGTVVLAQRRVE